MRQDRDYSRTFYVTEYALSKGIIEVKGCIIPDSTNSLGEVIREYGGKLLDALWPGGINGRALFHRPHWHETLEGAKARVVKVARAKLKSLDKQRAKVERLAAGEVSVVKSAALHTLRNLPKKAAKARKLGEESTLQGWADTIGGKAHES